MYFKYIFKVTGEEQALCYLKNHANCQIDRPCFKRKGNRDHHLFYKRMFDAHPELKNIFNMSRQQTGGQPKALAFTVLQAAENIDRLEDLLPVVKQIGHKHKSLHVKPEHYPIVGQHLLEAIEIVLGEAATEDILQAWAEAYEEIARVFIEVENKCMRKTKAGWKLGRV